MEHIAGIKVKGQAFSCFGFINGSLYLGSRHHMAIMRWLLDNGFDWEKLASADQVWGWVDDNSSYDGKYKQLEVTFSTDAGFLQESQMDACVQAFRELFPGYDVETNEGWGQSNESFAPAFDDHYGEGGAFEGNKLINVYKFTPTGKIPVAPEQTQMPGVGFPPPQKPKPKVPLKEGESYSVGGGQTWVIKSINGNVATVEISFPTGYQILQDYGVKTIQDWVDQGALTKSASIDDPHDFPGNKYGCFGFVEDTLYLGVRHHMAIMQFLMENGFDWERLSTAKQVWGWIWTVGANEIDQNYSMSTEDPSEVSVSDGYQYNYDYDAQKAHEQDQYYMRTSTDAGQIDLDILPECKHALEEFYQGPFRILKTGWQSNKDYAPNFNAKYGPGGYYHGQDAISVRVFKPTDQTIIPGGGTPPPKKNAAWQAVGATKFVYDSATGRFEASDDWKTHHMDLLARHGFNEPDDVDEVARVTKPAWNPARFVFGEHADGEEPEVWNDLVPLTPDKREAALVAYNHWRQNVRTATTVEDRVVWMLDDRGQFHMSTLGSSMHHVDIGWNGGEQGAGDIIVEPGGQITCRVLELAPGVDASEMWDLAEQKWDKLYPDLPITSFKKELVEEPDYGEDDYLHSEAKYDIISSVTNKLEEPRQMGNWNVYEMRSGEYPHHDAILIDRTNGNMFINYEGHHSPLVGAMSDAGLPISYDDDTANGHYRLAPSTTEPFAEGWGWHGNEATPEEKEILKQVLREHYNVNKLTDAWVTKEGGQKKGAKPSFEWLETGAKKNQLNWKALYDVGNSKVYLWKTTGLGDSHPAMMKQIDPEWALIASQSKNGGVGRFALAAGSYHNVHYTNTLGFADPASVNADFRANLDQALKLKWPTIDKETNFKVASYLRFMVKDDGQVILGPYDTHFDLIHDYQSQEAAYRYDEGDLNTDEVYPFIGGGFINHDGTIELVHSIGEPEFDPVKVAVSVARQAEQAGVKVNDEVVYYDDRQIGPRQTHRFYIDLGGADDGNY